MIPLNIQLLVEEFYAIEAIVAMLSNNKLNKLEPMRHSHSRWYRDFHAFRDEYVSKFAEAIYDYTALVVAAELRHCEKQASHYLKDFYHRDFHARDHVFRDCTKYNPHDILTAGSILFDEAEVEWDGPYGGMKWLQIAKAGLRREKLIDSAFVDHCVDLSHNNSVYFDKGAGIFRLSCTSSYQEFLTLKATCMPRELLKKRVGRRLVRLLMRANTLSIINELPSRNCYFINPDEVESGLLNYEPIQWGKEKLDYSANGIVVKITLDGSASNEAA